MGQIQDRVVGGLAVNALQFKFAAVGQGVEHHLAALGLDGGQLGGVAEQHQRREDVLQVCELLGVKHRAFVYEPDIKRVFAAFPAGDEIGPAQASGGQRGGDG